MNMGPRVVKVAYSSANMITKQGYMAQELVEPDSSMVYLDLSSIGMVEAMQVDPIVNLPTMHQAKLSGRR